MKEITFLKNNSEKWEEMEASLNEESFNNPKRLSEIFLEITNDLSYARTYFPNSTTTAYLNGLAARIHQIIYKNKKENRKRIGSFWTKEVPKLFYAYQKQLVISFFVFMLGALIGAVSQYYNEDFVRLVLSDGYVNETMERIKDGNPLGIYGEEGQVSMFVFITTNNVRVSFIVFAMGLVFSVGAGAMLFKEGIRLGAFHAMFVKYGYLTKSLMVVYIHGTLEISAIIIAACAGFALGNSFMFPGTYRRIDSFKRGAKDSLKIAVSLVPVFICAGFLESFVTRYTEMPVWCSLLIIGVSFAFIIFYFVVYPIVLNNKTIKYRTKPSIQHQ